MVTGVKCSNVEVVRNGTSYNSESTHGRHFVFKERCKLVSRVQVSVHTTRLTEYSVENLPKLFAVACTSCNFILRIGTVFLFVKRQW